MAHFVASNKDGLISEGDISLTTQNDERRSDYSYNNNLLNQKIYVPNILGKHTYTYPVDFPEKVTSVIISNDAQRKDVFIEKFDNSQFTINIVNQVPKTNKIEVIATGY